MKNNHFILIKINKYAAIGASILLVIHFLISFSDFQMMFSSNGLRLLIMTLTFCLLFSLRSSISFGLLSILTIATFVGGLLLYPFYASGIDASDIVVITISLLMTSVIPHAIYHPIKNYIIILLWNTAFLIITLFGFVDILDELSIPFNLALKSILEEAPRVPFALLGAFLAINWILHRYQLTNFEINSQIEDIKSNAQIQLSRSTHQQLKLKEQHELLIDLQNQLEKSIQQLEDKVTNNTQKINEKVKLLLKYSYVNSHYLRAPISRIQGLLHVWELVDPDKRKSILTFSTNELNSVIEAIMEINEKQMDSTSTEDYIESYLNN